MPAVKFAQAAWKAYSDGCAAGADMPSTILVRSVDTTMSCFEAQAAIETIPFDESKHWLVIDLSGGLFTIQLR